MMISLISPVNALNNNNFAYFFIEFLTVVLNIKNFAIVFFTNHFSARHHIVHDLMNNIMPKQEINH